MWGHNYPTWCALSVIITTQITFANLFIYRDFCLKQCIRVLISKRISYPLWVSWCWPNSCTCTILVWHGLLSANYCADSSPKLVFLNLIIVRKSPRDISLSRGRLLVRVSPAPGLRPWRQWRQWRWWQTFLMVSIFCFIEALLKSHLKKGSVLPRWHFLDVILARPRNPNCYTCISSRIPTLLWCVMIFPILSRLFLTILAPAVNIVVTVLV